MGEGTWFTCLLGALSAHIQPSVLATASLNKRLVWLPHSKLETVSQHGQVIGDSRVGTRKQHLITLPGVYGNKKLESSVTTANKPFSPVPRGLYSCVVNELTTLTGEGWTNFEDYKSSNLKPYQSGLEALNGARRHVSRDDIRVGSWLLHPTGHDRKCRFPTTFRCLRI